MPKVKHGTGDLTSLGAASARIATQMSKWVRTRSRKTMINLLTRVIEWI